MKWIVRFYFEYEVDQFDGFGCERDDNDAYDIAEEKFRQTMREPWEHFADGYEIEHKPR